MADALLVDEFIVLPETVHGTGAEENNTEARPAGPKSGLVDWTSKSGIIFKTGSQLQK